jgi:hypothetical protein
VEQCLEKVVPSVAVIDHSDLKLRQLNPLNAELNPFCHLLALLGAHHIFHVSGLRVKKCGGMIYCRW